VAQKISGLEFEGMDTAIRDLLKSAIDPLVFSMGLMGIGLLVSFRGGLKRWGKIIFLSAFGLLYLASISPVSNGLCYFLERNYFDASTAKADKLDVVVVLGGGVSDNKYLKKPMLSSDSASRLIRGIEAFKRNGAKYLVCCGKGWREVSEAEVMCNGARDLGISENSIIVDDSSMNTREHAAEVARMFETKNVRIGLISSGFHMKRSEREFKKHFPNIIPLPSNFLFSRSSSGFPPLSAFLPSSQSLYKSATAVREMIGIIWYSMKTS